MSRSNECKYCPSVRDLAFKPNFRPMSRSEKIIDVQHTFKLGIVAFVNYDDVTQ